MFHIASTRFTSETWLENNSYRERKNIPAIYGTDIKIRNTYMPGISLFVLEMNNDINQVMGISLITNNIIPETHNIYMNYAYNFYIYKGKYWISRENIIKLDSEIIEIADKILFKGKSHLKRQSGISILTDKLFANWKDYSLNELKRRIANIYNKSITVNNNQF